MDVFVFRLTRVYHLVKFVGRYIQALFGIISGNHYSLVNVSDDDFSFSGTSNTVFTKENEKKDWNEPHISDLFHIYLSKILYEDPDRIEEQCLNWGFEKGSIRTLTYSQTEDLRKYPYSTAATVIEHESSKTIIIGFRGTEPMDLLQWMTDASTDFTDIVDVFNDVTMDNNEHDSIRVHAGFYYALGLSKVDPSQPIDFDRITFKSTTPMFLQLLKCIQTFKERHDKCNISITGHSLGGGLASLFSFVLLIYGYQSSINGVYTYGQPLVGNRRYAKVLNKRLANRIHRWVNNGDIVTRIPVIELPSIAKCYARIPYSDALEVAGNNKRKKSLRHRHYYHSGLRFRIDHQGNLFKEPLLDQGPTLAYQDKLRLFDLIYSIKHAIHSLVKITPLRSLLWLTMPADINDHFPGDYARKIKHILKTRQ